ncbi:MAG: hypothetical protein U0X39_01380 [Bacteroidales bacterium]
MRKATKSDKKLVVDILTKTFDKNPGLNWMFRKRMNHQKALRRISTYAFSRALARDGVYISSNEMGVALCFRFNERVFSLGEFIHMVWYGLTCIRLDRIPKVLGHEAYRAGIRPASGDYLYFWFFGVLHEGKEAGFELKNAIFNKSIEDNIPIFVETTLERNVIVYERYGFKRYHYWEDKKDFLQMWFLKWDPAVEGKNHKPS